MEEKFASQAITPAQPSLRGLLCRLLDRSVIRLAAARMPGPRGLDPHLREAAQLLGNRDFFFAPSPIQLEIVRDEDFRFSSSIRTPFPENNIARGRILRCPGPWTKRPAVILLHGLNDPLTYNRRFPWLARRLNAQGINCLSLELPYHFSRRPVPGAPVRNFISEDLLRTLEAARQGVADIRSLAGWLWDSGCPRVGIWGISLGAWLGGLAACHDRHIEFSVLMTPMARLERAVAELAFVEPLRRSIQGQTIDFSRVNLVSHRPKTAPKNVLLVEAEYDLFAPKDTIEELWQRWRQPDIWRVPHGHISLLMANAVMQRTVDWVVDQAGRK